MGADDGQDCPVQKEKNCRDKLETREKSQEDEGDAAHGSVVGVEFDQAAVGGEFGIEFAIIGKTAFDFDSSIAFELDFLETGIGGPGLVFHDFGRDKSADIRRGKEIVPANFDILDHVIPIEIDLDNGAAGQGAAYTAAIFGMRFFANLDIGQVKIDNGLRQIFSKTDGRTGEAGRNKNDPECVSYGFHFQSDKFGRGRDSNARAFG